MKKAVFIAFLSFVFYSFFSCAQKQEKPSLSFVSPANYFSKDIKLQKIFEEKAIKSYLESHSLKAQLSQLFIVNLEGSIKYNEKLDLNKAYVPGGFIFFSYNIANSPENIMTFTDSIYDYYKDSIPPFLALDLEGGEVNRLRHYVNLPSPKEIVSLFTPKEAEVFYKTIAEQTKLLGFSLNLAPILEALLPENSGFLGSRSFGSLENSFAYSEAFINAFNEENILCSLKHFPGNANNDPHFSLPFINVKKDYFDTNMLISFEKVLKNLQKNNAVLLSHAIVPIISDKPSSISPEIISLLKKDLNYQGLIITDDIFMGALKNFVLDENDAIFHAIDAGADIILSSKKEFYYYLDFLEELYNNSSDFKEKIDYALMNIIKAKIETGLISFSEKNEWKKLSLNLEKPENNITNRIQKFYNSKTISDEILIQAKKKFLYEMDTK